MLQGVRKPRTAFALVIALALCALLLTAGMTGTAAAAGLLGKDGKVYACYRTKGKAKGTVRLVAKRKHCRKGEKKISWNAAGQAGESGQNGSGGESGLPGELGLGGVETRVEKLIDRVESLEDKLKGITNATLNEVISKLQGVSGAQLQEAVKAVANVNALCAQAKTLTTQTNALGTVIGGLSVNNALALLGGALSIPAVPPPLSAFGCPA
ncbi:MAG: hypothetical protein QOE56_331 [Solirubrobacterales bacterium]|jgi:hypothetical protein|nr:hypothetical protein [Solirubrobacterales bacterium]